MEARDRHEEQRDVVAEAVFTGEEIEELSFVPTTAVVTAIDAVLMNFMKDLFVRERPGDAGDGNCQQKELDNLKAKRWHCPAVSTHRSANKVSAAGANADGRRSFSERYRSHLLIGRAPGFLVAAVIKDATRLLSARRNAKERAALASRITGGKT